jgi:hypothetical protein
MEPVAVININIILAGVAQRCRENSFINAFTLRHGVDRSMPYSHALSKRR